MSTHSMIVTGLMAGVAALSAAAQNLPQSEAKSEMNIVKFAFDDAAANALPPGWTVDSTLPNGETATWKVVADEAAPSSPNVLALTESKHGSATTFNLCWTDQLRFREGAIEVRFKPAGGTQDQGGGIIWRVKDSNNYYVCRANPLERNVRLYCVHDAARKMLGSSTVDLSANAWHKLRISHQGDEITCELNDQTLLVITDSTFAEAGGVGLWTKADATTRFDDLTISRPADSAEVIELPSALTIEEISRMSLEKTREAYYKRAELEKLAAWTQLDSESRERLATERTQLMKHMQQLIRAQRNNPNQ